MLPFLSLQNCVRNNDKWAIGQQHRRLQLFVVQAFQMSLLDLDRSSWSRDKALRCMVTQHITACAAGVEEADI